jgi:hypothetical protein
MPFRPIIFIAIPMAQFAGFAAAADYSLAPSVLDHGGLQAGSANYSASFSAAPGGVGSSSNYSLRSGYAGQLFDLNQLTVVDFVLPASLAADGSEKSISASAGEAGALSLSYEGRGFTSYDSSFSAPASPGLYRVSATALSEEYTGSVFRDFVISGPLAAADSLTKPADNSPISIAVNELLANDTRVLPDGSVTSEGLSIIGVTAGGGNSVYLGEEEDDGWIFFSSSSSPSEAFGYIVSDGVSIANAVVTVTALGTTPALSLQFVSSGIPLFDGSQTSLSMDFIAVPGQNYEVEWSTDLSTWNSAGISATGLTGSFTMTLSQVGDYRSAWSHSLFFRAKRL